MINQNEFDKYVYIVGYVSLKPLKEIPNSATKEEKKDFYFLDHNVYIDSKTCNLFISKWGGGFYIECFEETEVKVRTENTKVRIRHVVFDGGKHRLVDGNIILPVGNYDSLLFWPGADVGISQILEKLYKDN